MSQKSILLSLTYGLLSLVHVPTVAPEAILNWCGEKIFKKTYRVYREIFFKTHFIKNCKTGVATATPVL